eukprot:CAMPEP_0119300732 /NCGR_PEP_ID=MMETSP1333-20130426/2647_1 /TAXON_ID=418940 /ORGANISM="Scyphosphaera apsteinii, Strain RCC1455" /LENGTH=425 /DNA_ID=CAMNT_0007302619 /DNA_START=63 /DNA_END=1340 /DNA_ORIENTATION=+
MAARASFPRVQVLPLNGLRCMLSKLKASPSVEGKVMVLESQRKVIDPPLVEFIWPEEPLNQVAIENVDLPFLKPSTPASSSFQASIKGVETPSSTGSTVLETNSITGPVSRSPRTKDASFHQEGDAAVMAPPSASGVISASNTFATIKSQEKLDALDAKIYAYIKATWSPPMHYEVDQKDDVAVTATSSVVSEAKTLATPSRAYLDALDAKIYASKHLDALDAKIYAFIETTWSPPTQNEIEQRSPNNLLRRLQRDIRFRWPETAVSNGPGLVPKEALLEVVKRLFKRGLLEHQPKLKGLVRLDLHHKQQPSRVLTESSTPKAFRARPFHISDSSKRHVENDTKERTKEGTFQRVGRFNFDERVHGSSRPQGRARDWRSGTKSHPSKSSGDERGVKNGRSGRRSYDTERHAMSGHSGGSLHDMSK